MAIEWDAESMGTGVASIDKQHQELIRMLNELMDANKQGKGKEEIGKMVDFLGHYAKTHFTHEEGIMDKHQCPAAAHNKQAHARFLEDFTKLVEKFEQQGPSVAFILEVQQKVVHWLMNHIRGCDTQLRTCAGVCQT